MSSPTVTTGASGGAGSGTSQAVNAGANFQGIGTIILAAVYTPAGTAHVSPTGWILLSNPNSQSSLWAKTVYGAEPASYTWNWTTSSASVIVMVPILGASGPSGFEVSGGQANASSANIVALAVSPAKSATDLLVSFYLTASATSAVTIPGGQSEITQCATHQNTVASAVGWENLTATGTTGTRTATATAAVNVGFNVALCPAIGSIGTGTTFPDPFVVAGTWWSGAAKIGNPIWGTGVSTMSRQLPIWLADVGVGPDSSVGGSVNISQLGIGVACQPLLSANVAGSLSGWVKINGVAQVGAIVALFYRPTMELIKRTTTDASGNYSFSGLDTTAVSNSAYFAVALDPDGLATQYNAEIFDRLIPV